MFEWLIHKSKIEKLQERYKRLMRKSFELSLKDKQKSDVVHNEALKIKHQIRQLKHQQS